LERLSREVTAVEIMTTDVVTVKPDTPVAEVAAAMGRRGVSGVPVVDAGQKVVGVISEKDFLTRMGVQDAKNFMSLVANCLMTKGCMALPIKAALAQDIMSAPAVTVAPDTPVKDIAALLTQQGINRVAVTDPAARLLGLVSRGDIVKATMGRGRHDRQLLPQNDRHHPEPAPGRPGRNFLVLAGGLPGDWGGGLYQLRLAG